MRRKAAGYRRYKSDGSRTKDGFSAMLVLKSGDRTPKTMEKFSPCLRRRTERGKKEKQTKPWRRHNRCIRGGGTNVEAKSWCRQRRGKSGWAKKTGLGAKKLSEKSTVVRSSAEQEVQQPATTIRWREPENSSGHVALPPKSNRFAIRGRVRRHLKRTKSTRRKMTTDRHTPRVV